MSIHQTNWVPLPVQPSMPAPLPAPPGGQPLPRHPAAPATPDRGLRQPGPSLRGPIGTPSSAPASREAQLAEARGDVTDKGELGGGAPEAVEGRGVATAFERVEGRSAPSRDSRRDRSGVSGRPDQKADSDEAVRPTDVVGLFTAPGRNADEDVVKQIVRELETVQANRLKRKIEVIVTMARAGGSQDRSQMAICEEAMRDVDMQFDELERVLGVRLREAKQAVAARQVRAGATASYLIIAADQHDRRQLRQRLETQREALRKAIIAASAASGALNATPLIALLQALQDQVECELVAQEESLQTNSARMGAEQLKQIEARRAQALRLIGDAWRRAGETQSGLVGMFTEVRQGVEQRFEHQREQVIDV
ncbi:MAG TPA: hypothetical protein VFL86_00965 [Burkholderiaceae bacterium]|nr:hypothetical protein [Burkholderiaceae bacterium]